MAEVSAEVIAAQRVRELRQAFGWTQQYVVERLRAFDVVLDQSSVARIENGSRLIRLSEAIAFARVFDVTIERLVSVRPDSESLSSLERRIDVLEAEVAEAARAAEEAAESVRAHRAAAEEASKREVEARSQLSLAQGALRALQVELRAVHALRAGGEVHLVGDAKQGELVHVGTGQLFVHDSPETILTPREEEVLNLIADGLTYSRVAATLAVSVRTVETHVANIRKKLGVSSRRELEQVDYAVAHRGEKGAR
ncbi:LuxR C-terminal-related transcriptional regulator [Nonomuraea sp. NPDC001023]|uniref:LuxR C-terminal-related transcriptional regulator n=1 Tax=unclassified Nonomuraea TaxID=2593643 RepID=UPI00333209A4